MRSIILIFVCILIIVFGITVGIQNSQEVQVRFLHWRIFPLPLWVVSYASAALGALLALSASLIAIIKANTKSRHLRKQVKELEGERDYSRNIGVTHDIPPAAPKNEA